MGPQIRTGVQSSRTMRPEDSDSPDPAGRKSDRARRDTSVGDQFRRRARTKLTILTALRSSLSNTRHRRLLGFGGGRRSLSAAAPRPRLPRPRHGGDPARAVHERPAPAARAGGGPAPVNEQLGTIQTMLLMQRFLSI